MGRIRIQVSGEPGRTDNYSAAIRSAGGDPASGYCPAPDLNCAGLVLCGGGDIESALFGQEDQGSNPPDQARDQAELALFRAFYEAGKPILGICRGMQLINVALGGTLTQDLPPEQKIFHISVQGDLVHPVFSPEGAALNALYGPVFSVNSAHHQAVDQLAEGLEAAAWSESGVVEALELPGYPMLGLQFHPERMAFGRRRLDTVDGAAIFAWFLDACRKGAEPSPRTGDRRAD